MEEDSKTDKKKKLWSREKRSPLQHLNNSFSSNSSSSSSCSSRKPLAKKPKVSSATSSLLPKSTSLRSNDLPIPTSRKPRKNPPFFSGNKPTSQKSNLSSHISKKSAFGVKSKSVRNNSGEIQILDLINVEKNCTPVGKLTSATLDDNCKEEKSNTSTKTPPVEASVSPEIQCGGLGLVSAATPCYAAGHVLSGVTDKRKCRPRGILTIGTVGHFSDDTNSSRRASLIPLPAEASMHWLSSQGNVVSEDDCVSEFRMLMGSSEVTSDLEPSGGKDQMHRNLFPCTPLDKSCCNDVNVPDEWKCSCSLVRDNSPCSTVSLSSENVIQTPQSDSSSGKCGGFSWFHSGDYGDNIGPELDSVTELLDKTSLSPRIQTSAWDPPIVNFANTSWVSDSTLDNVSQSQMRISWRDGIVSRIFEIDDVDCCRCLSDDENGGYCHTNVNENVSVESPAHDEKHLLPETGLQSPEFLEHKHETSRHGKLTSPPPEANSCAESIQTVGGGLVSSADSDWSLCYNNQSYQV